jgi:hypothetical protein
VRDAGADAPVESDGSSGEFTCNLLLGLSSTGEWVNQGGFLTLVDGTRWEAITKEHEYVQLFADPTDTIWTQHFDPPDAGVPHSCAANSTTPDRVIVVVFATNTDTTYNDFADPTDPTVQAAWVTILGSVVTTVQSKYTSVKRIELMTMIRGPGTSGPGTDCMPAATTTHEDIVEPWVDNAIAIVAQNNPSLVFAAQKFYVGDCSWFATNGGPHFLPGGRPDLVAQMVAAYYTLHP